MRIGNFDILILMKNILLTGKPKSGKSTLLRKLIQNFPHKVGFVVNEVLENGERVGFEMETHENKRTVIAHIGYDKQYSVGKYGVSLDKINSLLPSVTNFTDEILYLDEIGQMQVQSEEFVKLVVKYLHAENACLGTISSVYENEFIAQTKKRDDVTLYEVTEENRDELYEDILKSLSDTLGI